MEEMRSWRNPASSQVQPLLGQQIYSQGSPETKDLMKLRDKTRENIKKAKGGERLILLTKYMEQNGI